jgi:hypothetical protein
LYTNDLDTKQFSGASSHDKPQPDTSFTDLISVGLFEQQPAAELALFLYALPLRYHSSELTEM